MNEKVSVGVVEILIIAAVGLIVTIVTINYLSIHIKARNYHTAQVMLKTNSILAINTLSEQLENQAVRIIGPDGGDCLLKPCTITHRDNSDQLVIQRQGSETARSCDGSIITQQSAPWEVYAVVERHGYRALTCRLYDPSAQQWIQNGHSFLVRSGIEALKLQFYQQEYPRPVSIDQVTDWNQVQGIEVALIVSSEIPATGQRQDQHVQLFQEHEYLFENTRIARAVLERTIAFQSPSRP